HWPAVGLDPRFAGRFCRHRQYGRPDEGRTTFTPYRTIVCRRLDWCRAQSRYRDGTIAAFASDDWYRTGVYPCRLAACIACREDCGDRSPERRLVMLASWNGRDGDTCART